MKIKNCLLYSLLLLSTLFVSCKDDNDVETPLSEGQGEVSFRFYERTVYTIDDIADVARLKVTLNQDGKDIVLPTVDMTTDGEERVSETLRLDVGIYDVTHYVAYDNKGAQLSEVYLPLNGKNKLEVKHGEMTSFYFPVNILEVQSSDMVMNKLFGICEEALGPDSTKWPKTWREENTDLTKWENLECEEDDNGGFLYVTGIIFDGKFKGMKKLPASVARITTLENIMIRDLEDFEEIPSELNESNIQSLEIINTSLKSLPDDLYMKNLYKISIIDSKLTEFPSCLSNQDKLEMLDLVGNDITQIPENAFDKLANLSQLRIQHTKITSLPANTFMKLYRVYTFDLRWNPNLASLPAESPETETKFQGLLLDGCGFTDIPEVVKTAKLKTVSMTDNKLTSVDFGKFNIQSLDQLFLDGNQLTSFGRLVSDKMILLSLNNCGLSAIPDLSGMKNLRYFSAANNHITTVAAGQFKTNTKLSVIDLSGNTSLTTVPADFGVYTENKEYTVESIPTEVNAVPVNLTAVNLDGCTGLTWTVPASWCCLDGYIIFGGNGDKQFPRRPVIVYNRNAAGVTYHACWNNKCPYRLQSNNYQLPFRQNFDEIWAAVHNN